jgi:hypothetical protein
MKVSGIAAAGLTATALLAIGVSVGGCSSNNSTSSGSASSKTSSSTSSAQTSQTAIAGDYSNLLIKPTDITVPGDTFTLAQPPMQNPNGQPGVAAVFTNSDGTRQIGDTILVLPDASAAATALEGAKASLGSVVTGGTPQPVAVGTGGTMVSGTSPDGSKAVTVLQFTEGKAFATLEFDSAPTDPVPPEVLTDVGQKQDTAIKDGLPS